MEETLQQTGKELEANGNTAEAIDFYEHAIARSTTDAFPYQRLIILYNRQKDYRKELRVLKKGIAVFTAQLKEKQAQVFGNKPKRKSLLQLSKKMAQQLGLLNSKGDHAVLPPPLDKWTTRKKLVERKLKKF